ncbi:hypothetical protein LRP49_12475 [Enterovibrio sp. ZSDZ35]|uniref:Lipoprotein n=1 Tax=Enterovibrio qingdaonensis TaxID=2899818 RepID=A0ABT5QLX5_9GAMM|nr:hypothetical protein [Enterovibrio sp. ZSDZ35]MDD1781986.1 hypothetical protein [Enterovibrio sp. ZSDZ35]
MFSLNHRLPQTLLALTLATLLSACSTSPSGPVELGNSDDLLGESKATQQDTITAQRFMLRGDITLGHEVRTITPCGSNTQYWLQLPANLNQEGMALSSSPYSAIYGEVIGEFVPPAVDGFAADYPATFKVTQLNLMSAEISGCKQARDKTVASGNEPFWSVSMSGDTLKYQQMGEQSETYPLTARSISPAARVYDAENASLTLTPALCNDTMSDSIYGWKSTFSQDGETRKGCATLSADDPTQNWVAQYRGQTRLGDTTLTTTLTLNADHSATTVYEQVGSAPLTETGVWQQSSDNKVHVMMSRHQGQYLISEREFTRHGFVLTADSEIVNGSKYSLGPDGLSLSLVVGTEKHLTSPGAEVKSRADFNPKVNAALNAYLGDTIDEVPDTKYRWLTQDLNGDNNKELLVLTDWCGSGGCTVLIFANQNGHWQFNSRITLAHVPFQMSNATTNGWHDLIFPVGGGGAKPASHVLQFNGVRYPGNPSVAPKVSIPDTSDTQLFADGLYPQREGVTLK